MAANIMPPMSLYFLWLTLASHEGSFMELFEAYHKNVLDPPRLHGLKPPFAGFTCCVYFHALHGGRRQSRLGLVVIIATTQ
jgi:hypothetical protein